mmetsp:Transcript_26732/g.58963  ORF Transcript_26732/g.58963 Transcript_26732/m.58963 type:complete len:211 (-) Transcript_26732:694-1326(-)
MQSLSISGHTSSVKEASPRCLAKTGPFWSTASRMRHCLSSINSPICGIRDCFNISIPMTVDSSDKVPTSASLTSAFSSRISCRTTGSTSFTVVCCPINGARLSNTAANDTRTCSAESWTKVSRVSLIVVMNHSLSGMALATAGRRRAAADRTSASASPKNSWYILTSSPRSGSSAMPTSVCMLSAKVNRTRQEKSCWQDRTTGITLSWNC